MRLRASMQKSVNVLKEENDELKENNEVLEKNVDELETHVDELENKIITLKNLEVELNDDINKLKKYIFNLTAANIIGVSGFFTS